LSTPRIFVYKTPYQKKQNKPQECNKYINFLSLRRMLLVIPGGAISRDWEPLI